MTRNFDDDLKAKLMRLLDPNHFEHEDIIRYLQKSPDPRSVPAIRKAIELKSQLKCLDYDDYGAYYKKFLWALQEIGTDEAIQVIRECAESEIPELRQQAIHRLLRIEES